MSWAAEYLLNFHNWRNSVSAIKSRVHADKLFNLQSNDSAPIRIGVLSVAGINYTAIIDPVSTHNSTFITAFASRDKSKADNSIKLNKLSLPGPCTAYGSYDELINDPDIDAIYIPLPNGLHHQYALAALEKGKHVLIEKPITSNAREAKEIRSAAAKSGKVALEAFHWRLHPAAHYVKSLLLSGDYGAVLSVDARCCLPAGLFPRDDIRFKYELAGGCSMDLTYVFSAIAYFGARDSTDPNVEFEVLDTKYRLNEKDKLVDERVEATILIKDPKPYGASDLAKRDIRATVVADSSEPWLFGIFPRLSPNIVTIHAEKAEIVFPNFMGPWVGHSISITPVTRDPTTGNVAKRGKKASTTCYRGGPVWEQEEARAGGKIGEEWWTTYRYQLEAFVRKIKEPDEYSGPWVGLDESVRVMEIIDAVYEKGGLPVRGA